MNDNSIGDNFSSLILYQKGSCAYLAEKNSGPGAEATTIS